MDQLGKRVVVRGGEVTSSLNKISMDQLGKRVVVRGGGGVTPPTEYI